MKQNADRRVLGALRLLDAPTGAPVERGMTVESSPAARFVRNLSGWYVVAAAPKLAAYAGHFLNPLEERDPGPDDDDAIPFESVTLDLSVRDPSEEYLPRLATCRLPLRSNLPRPGGAFPDGWVPGPLFRPMDITMYRSTAAPVRPNWAAIYVSVFDAGSSAPLGGALLRLFRNGIAAPVARGLADGRGEALVAVPGLPRITWPDDDESASVLVSEIDATLEVIWNPKADGVADPDFLERERAHLVSQSFPLKMAAGRTTAIPLPVTVP